jgi:hypothetical protein
MKESKHASATVWDYGEHSEGSFVRFAPPRPVGWPGVGDRPGIRCNGVAFPCSSARAIASHDELLVQHAQVRNAESRFVLLGRLTRTTDTAAPGPARLNLKERFKLVQRPRTITYEI